MKKRKNIFRFTVSDNNTLEELFAFKLSKPDIFISLFLFLSAFFVICTLFLGFTPLKNLIPGKSKNSVQKELINIILKSDSLESVVTKYGLYTKNLKMVLSDSLSLDSLRLNSEVMISKKNLDLKTSAEDSSLRMMVETEESISINPKLFSSKSKRFFTKPLSGYITQKFDKNINHFGVDIVSKKDEAIVSIDEGVVLFSSYTNEFGFVIIIKHPNNFISLYKHNSKLFKVKGDYTKSGEIIAIVGNSGKYSSGPHLHFELWENGEPVDPVKYVLF